MHPTALVACLGVLWILLHFWLLPLTKDRWQAADLRTKMARAGALVVLEKLRDLAAAGTCAVALVLLMVLLANGLGGAGVVWPKAAIEAMASVYSTAKSLADGYDTVLVTIGLLGGAFILWRTARSARQRVARVWVEKAEEEHAALRAHPERIDAARQDPELLPIVQRIDAAIASLNAEERAETPDPAAIARWQEMLGQAVSQLALESARKQVDFPSAAATATDAEKTMPRKPWQRVMAAVASKRFGEDLGLVRKPAGWVVTGLLFVSLMGWAAEPLADSLQLAVNNLRAQFVESEAQRGLDEALSRAPEPSPTRSEPPALRADAVPVATRLLTQAVVRELSRAPLLDQTAGARRAVQSESEFVRSALAEQKLPAGGAVDDAATRVRAEVARTLVEPPATNGPLARHVADELQPTLQQLQQKQPARLAALVERLEARYATPMSPLDAQGKLTAKLLDDVFSGLDVKAQGELARQAQMLTKDFGKEAVKTWADGALKQFMTDTLTGVARPEVQRAFAFQASDASRHFLASLQASEGQGWHRAPAMARESQMASKVGESVARLHPGLGEAERRVLTERLSGYEQLFPRDHGPLPSAADAMPGTPHSPGTGGPGGGGKPAPGAAPHGTPHSVQARATSFQVASRSFRVRGVLVGQELTGPPLDVTDIRWRLLPPARPGAATRVAVELRIAESARAVPAWRDAGSFDAGVLNQALRYAADQRVVATTITAGDGRAFSRLTYLHPVLADTPLGCRIVESDRLVDTFTMMCGKEKPSAPALVELASDREQMYKWLRTLNLAEAVAGSTGATCPLDKVQRAVDGRKLTQVKFTPALEQSLDRFGAERATAAAASDGLLRKGGACAKGPVEKLAACLCEEVRPASLPTRYWFPEDHTSQVRERATRTSADLAWLRPSTDRLAHLDFWTHTTFSLRDASTGASDENATAALDFPPAQLAALRERVAELLPGYLAQQLRSPTYEEFMAPLEEFVLAQRLARAALGGQLGRDFPMARLIELEQQTRAFVPAQVTLRWEPVGTAPETTRELYDTLTRADRDAGERFKAHHLDMTSRMISKRPVCDRASR